MKPAVTDAATRCYVTLGAGSEVFAVDVQHVRKILDYQPITNLPHAPSFMVGMIDVRGRTVPVVDLRRRLGLPPIEIGENHRILVLEIPIAARTVVLGLLCDRVFEVAEFATTGLEAAPELGVNWKSEYIKGIGRWRGSFVIIFDMERLFSSDEIVHIERSR